VQGVSGGILKDIDREGKTFRELTRKTSEQRTKETQKMRFRQGLIQVDQEIERRARIGMR